MIISSKTSRSTSNVRRSEALVSRRGFLKRLTASGVMLAARTVSLWGIVGLAMAATTTGCGSEVGFSLASPASDGLTLGTWGPILQLETHPLVMVVLPSGKVLMLPWAPERFDPPHGPRRSVGSGDWGLNNLLWLGDRVGGGDSPFSRMGFC